MSTASYTVVGMTCGHCVNAVTEEVTQLPGGTAVDLDLPTGGLPVTSRPPFARAAVRAAVEDAGYEAAGRCRGPFCHDHSRPTRRLCARPRRRLRRRARPGCRGGCGRRSCGRRSDAR